MKAKHYKFDLAKYKKCSIGEFILRELTGEDEENAANLAKGKGSDNAVDEMVRLSLVYVDGKKVEQPYDDFDTWNSRTRAFVFSAWKQVNALDNEEIGTFLAEGQEVQVD